MEKHLASNSNEVGKNELVVFTLQTLMWFGKKRS